MDSLIFPQWLDTRELWRVRGSRILSLGCCDLITDAISWLRHHGITFSHLTEENIRPEDRQSYDLAVLCADAGNLDRLIPAMLDHCVAPPPFCIVLPVDVPEERGFALRFGAREVLSSTWCVEEIVSRIVWLLAARARDMRVHSVHATLRRRMSAKNKLLDDTRLEMIYRLGRAAEYRDNETGQHVIRVGKFSEVVARRLGLRPHEVKLLRHASPLHDIGKIGIADAILLKSSSLEPHEWSVMKQHTVIGSEILSGTGDELLETARTVALTHHEKWDGSGYPAGLKRNEIPLCGRIVAVCDVYDALTSERPYKRAWTHERALAYLTQSRSSHFDPSVVDAFVAVLPQIRAVQVRYADSAAPVNNYWGSQDLSPLSELTTSGVRSSP